MSKEKWIDSATKHAHGQFAAKAKRAGMTTDMFAKHVLQHPDQFSEKTRKQAQLAHTLVGMSK